MGNILILGLMYLLSANTMAMDLFFNNPQTFKATFDKKSQIEKRVIPACLNTTQQKAQNFYYCPDPSDLYKINKKWFAPVDWFSYEQSFVNKIDKFLGATWKGVNIGNIICLYQGKNSTFPVQLTNKESVFQPTKANWSTQPNKSGALECLAVNNNPCDCGFSYHKIIKKTPDEALTEFMKMPKKNPPPYTSPFYNQ
jgi:hypothetical protein